MEKLFRKYYLRTFYVITFLFSILLLTLHYVFRSAGDYSVSFTQLSPVFAVAGLALLLKDKTIIKDIRNHFRVDKSVVKWLITAIVIPAVCIIVSSFIMTYYEVDFVAWEGDALFYLLNFVAILIGCAAEEIGWRGFLLPNLQKKYTPFTSGVIVGILWGVWHLNFTGGLLGFVLYTVTIIEMSILMTWLYNKSAGNLVLMTVWHFTFNVTSHMFLWGRFTLQLFAVESTVFGILCLFLFVTERNSSFFKSSAGSIEV
ncbi:CPBP family intramembrane glutamic endopeptidase [Trichococcus alkaliphilus]|uniref:CPBP family intramembrane glutamic endopeptidase n=1 Tax=Trichococcus alkaliphilus TaxID=2052943 RepID=UPI000D0B885D|nr:type II CAAX endopeptidase family protein [Trichococcus alkaliphilus]